MFIYMLHPSVQYKDMRYAMLDRSDPVAKKILSAAKSAAVKEWKGTANEKTRDLLRKRMSELDTGQLNHLYHIYMLLHPTTHAGATGAGGIWAWASRVVNEVAADILKDRPSFEIIE